MPGCWGVTLKACHIAPLNDFWTLAPAFTLGAYSVSTTGGPFGVFATSALHKSYVLGLQGVVV